MATPTLDRFLSEILLILRAKDGAKLQQYLILEPPYPDLYQALVSELKQIYPEFNRGKLEAKIEDALPEYEDDEGAGGAWPAFKSFLGLYFAFIQDVNISDLVKTHDDIRAVLNSSVLALSDSAMGLVVLPTVIFYSRTLAKLAIELEKHPELMNSTTRRQSLAISGGTDEAAERVTLVESSANTIREAFKKCLSERLAPANGGLDQYGRPAGRRVGIYVLANMCIRLFLRAHKMRSAEQIFQNIHQQSPPLSRFPAAQRVTYLYYLGRYHFANNHFLRARSTLQAAYDQCPRAAQCAGQRSLILTYLISANLILGRFPSAALLQRPDASSLARFFVPLCNAIRQGDVVTFRRMLNLDAINDYTINGSAAFFLRRNILLQLRDRGEVLLYRSLARRVFALAGFQGSAETKTAPNMSLNVLRDVLFALERRANPEAYTGRPYIDPDFEGAEELLNEGNNKNEDDEDDDFGHEGKEQSPTMAEVEAYVASMVQQGLLRGFVSHKLARFVVTGARGKNPVDVGFPRVWDMVKRGREDEIVPGWVRDGDRGQQQQGAAGRVIRLSNVKPISAGAD